MLNVLVLLGLILVMYKINVIFAQCQAHVLGINACVMLIVYFFEAWCLSMAMGGLGRPLVVMNVNNWLVSSIASLLTISFIPYGRSFRKILKSWTDVTDMIPLDGVL